MQELGEYLQQKRLNSGLSQRAVAKKLNLSSGQFISNVERGLCKPGTDHVGDRCKFIGANKNTVFRLLMADYRMKIRSGLKL